MSEREIKELEDLLLPFALERYNFDNYKMNMPMSRMMKSMVKSMAKSMVGNIITEQVTWLVRSFIRCLISISDEIYLKDLAAITLAEASYMAGIGPYGPFHRSFGSGGDRGGSEVQIEAEVHVWLLYLLDNNKLPGIYERFTGRYFIK
ncbi:MAG: hypothetical protein HGN29_14095 [Asgard group archaeon]|nr:hypothetical protein [Asgard group archaeon]